jgi:squalene-associated FAD-dependent desaturase
VDRVEDLAPRVTATAPPARGPLRVAVIGAGWAGCAAALELARRGAAVAVYEAAKAAGGRARRVVIDDLPLDNGQHLLVGAYRECLRLVDGLHRSGPGSGVSAPPYARLPLSLVPWGSGADAVRLVAGRGPAPLHLLSALATAEGLRWRSRAALARSLWRLGRRRDAIPAAASVTAWFGGLPRDAFDGVIAPLCVAALNTPPDQASARSLAHVLARTLAAARRDSDFILPSTDLTALFPEPALREVAARGGTIALGVSARIVAADPAGVLLAAAGEARPYDAAVIAVGPHQLPGVLAGTAAALPALRTLLATTACFDYEPITTVYLGCDPPVAAPAPILRLDDRPGQWLFVRRPAGTSREGTLLAVVISAHGSHERQDRDLLVAAVVAQLRRLRPGFPSVTWSRVITERRATFACRPALERPSAGLLAPGLCLAGDYTDAVLPATLEAAVASGVAAAGTLVPVRPG